MNKRILFATIALALAGAAQERDITGIVMGGQRLKIAIPDFRGSGGSEKFMDAFNQTLFSDVQDSGLVEMVGKSLYPLVLPQQPSDFQQPTAGPPPARRAPWLTDWSDPPVRTKYLAFGYAGVQGGQIVLSGWLFDVQQSSVASAQVLGKRYFGTVDENGARQVAHEFAADIIAKFGGESLVGSHIYFVSDRTGHKEIWSMDYDGSNQKQITHYRSICITPAVSPDGTKLAFTNLATGVNPKIIVFSLETGRQMAFYNPRASLNATPNFTPDGKHILFGSTVTDSSADYANIFMADVDGGHLQRISSSRKIEVEPKVNPKTGTDVVFSSGRSGHEQVWRMSISGTDVSMLTTGDGEASNPSWHPDGQIIAFSWTKGFDPGNFNIFLMDVATRHFDQVTHGAGRNENPNWAPDGRHLVFASNRNGNKMQIFTMLANGTQVKQLTTQGRNEMPVWGK